MDKKAADAEIEMRYRYSVRVLKTCVDAPDKVKEAAEILKELAEGGHAEAQCSLGDYYSQGCCIEPDQAKAASLPFRPIRTSMPLMVRAMRELAGLP